MKITELRSISKTKAIGAAFLLLAASFIGIASLIPSASAAATCSGTCLTVNAYYANGTPINGMWIEVQNPSTGSDLKTCYSPCTFSLTAYKQYDIYANSWQNIIFTTWAYPSTNENPLNYAVASGVHAQLEAFYDGSPTSTTTTASSNSTTTITSTTTVSSTTSTTSSTFTSTTSTAQSSHMGLIVPLYEYPDADWNTLISYKEQYPSVPVVAIINPDNGVGSSRDSTIATYIKDLQTAGIVVYGYDATGYCGNSLSSVESEVPKYANWYGVNGIFLDEMPTSGCTSYYSTLDSYVHGYGLQTIGNPGWSTSCNLVPTQDGMMIYETDGLPTLSFLSNATCGYSASHFNFIATKVSALPSQSWLDSASSSVAYAWITDKSATYDNLPSYLGQEFEMLAQTP